MLLNSEVAARPRTGVDEGMGHIGLRQHLVGGGWVRGFTNQNMAVVLVH